MPLDIPVSNPLTPAQAELTAKIGSMKSLLSLPFLEFKNIPKPKQISAFDYLMRILGALGISPKVIFQQFFSQILDQVGTSLEDAVIEGVAAQMLAYGVKLPGENIQPGLTPAEEEQVLNQNKAYIKQQLAIAGLSNFLQTAKQQIAKDLTIAIFGPKDGPAAEYLNPNATERQRIIDNAICAVDAFTLSNNAFIRDEDTEYNRIALARQLEKGEVIFEISCQEVKIKLPEDPSWIFEGGGQQTIQGGGITPAQSVTQLATYVESVTQQINNQANATDAGKTFWQILVEKFISNATNLIQPFVSPLLGTIATAVPGNVSVTPESIITNTCEILNDNSPSAPAAQKKKFGERLANMLLKFLLQLMLIRAIREFKKLVRNYFARIARERAKRKLEKIKARFNLIDDAAEAAEKAKSFASATASLGAILTNPSEVTL